MFQIPSQTPRKNIPRNRIRREHKLLSALEERSQAVAPLRNRMPIRRVALILTIVCIALIILIFLQINVDSTAQRIKDLERQINGQESKNSYTRREIDNKTTYDTIFPFVNSRFGMALPSSPKVIIHVPDEVIEKE